MRKIAKTLFKFLIISAVLKGIGTAVSRAFEGGHTSSDDDFKLMALMGSREFASEATSLRTGTAVAAMGGIDIDLRGAMLDQGGAHVALKVYMGGIRLIVPEEWRVYVDEDCRGGGIKVRTSPVDSAGDDAPRLTVEATARSGGILIEAEE